MMFADNTTAIPANPSPTPTPTPIDTEDGSPVTLANLSGIFLTLTFCLLTQPTGSLFYPRPSRLFGRVVFFFWRLNPLACVAEAVLVLYALATMSCLAVRDHRRATTVSDPPSLSERLHTGAAAILVLRGHGRIPEHWQSLAEEPGPSQSGATPQGDIESGIPPRQNHDAPAAGVSQTSTGYASNPTMDSNELRNEPDPPPYRDAIPESPAAGDEHRTGENIETGSIGEETPLLNTRFVRHALGRNVFAHSELLVDVVTFAAIIVIVIKMAVVVMPWYIQATVWCIIAGWLSVQLLLIAAHRREIEHIEPGTLIRSTLALNAQLSTFTAPALVIFLTLPVLAFVGYACSFLSSGVSKGVKISLRFVCMEYPSALVIYGGLMFHNWQKPNLRAVTCCNPCVEMKLPRWRFDFSWLWRIGDLWAHIRDHWKTIREVWSTILGVLVLGVVVFIGAFTLSMRWLKALEDCAGDPSNTEQCVITTATLVPFLGIFFYVPALPPTWVSEGVRIMTLMWNLAATFIIFAGTMVQYDPDGTYKPDWLDWFGRTFKTFDAPVPELSLFSMMNGTNHTSG